MVEPGARRKTLAAMGRALRHRNYRLFFAGQGISLTGSWITRVATSWLVWRLTGSELLLGLVGFAGQIPTTVVAPIAGVLIDRWNRHRVLVITQVASMLQSAALGILTLTGYIDVYQVMVLQALVKVECAQVSVIRDATLAADHYIIQSPFRRP